MFCDKCGRKGSLFESPAWYATPPCLTRRPFSKRAGKSETEAVRCVKCGSWLLTHESPVYTATQPSHDHSNSSTRTGRSHMTRRLPTTILCAVMALVRNAGGLMVYAFCPRTFELPSSDIGMQIPGLLVWDCGRLLRRGNCCHARRGREARHLSSTRRCGRHRQFPSAFNGVATKDQIAAYVDAHWPRTRKERARACERGIMAGRLSVGEDLSGGIISLYRESIQAWKATLRTDAASRWDYIEDSYNRLTLILEKSRQFPRPSAK